MAGQNKIEEPVVGLEPWKVRKELTKNFPTLTSAVRTIIHCPTNENNKDKYIPSLNAFDTFLTSAYPSPETELSEASVCLRNQLDSSSFQNPDSIRIGIKALFVTDILLNQASLPLEKRFTPKGTEEYKKEQLRHVGPADKLPAEEASQLKQSMEAFKQALEKELEVPEERESARIKAGVAAELLLMHTDNYLSSRSKQLGNPQFQEWWFGPMWKRISNFMRSTPVYELFVEKRFEHMDDRVKIYVWGAQWEEIAHYDHLDTQQKIDVQQKIGKLCEYFLEHPFLPKYFLGHFKPYRLDRPDQEDLREPKIFEKLSVDDFLSELYLQPANVIYDFLSAIPIKELKKEEQIAFFKKLLGESGFVFRVLGYDDNKAVIIKQLGHLAADLGINSALSEEFDILSDKKPGAIQLLFLRGQTRVVFPKKGQTREEFIDFLENEQMKKGKILSYVSSAQWTVEEPKELKPVKTTLSISPSETYWTSDWGQVEVPRVEDVPSILEWMNNNSGVKLDSEKLLDVAASYQNHLTTADNIVLLTELLPPNHPLSPLKKIGMMAVEQTGDKIQFVIDAKTAKIEVEGAAFVLQGTMQNGDLIIDGAKDDFPLSPLHLLLTAAELFRRRGFMEETLTKPELSQVHQLLKSWNKSAKGQNLPSLEYVEEGKRSPNGSFALYPLSEKTVLLNLSRIDKVK